MSIERYISPFIAQQFPSFYQEEGPNFVAFVKAYYEWMEQSNNAIGYSRSLLDINDIDLTQQQFIKYFKNTYIQSLPESIIANKQLMVKHILELYRSKGTKRAYELLFRLAFNEDIELYLPGEFIFKPSDNTWVVPRYLEVTSHPNIFALNGTQIQNNGKIGTATVSNVSEKIVNGRTINILELTDLRGYFKKGDKIFQTYGESVTIQDGPVIIGSLSGIAVTEGGTGFNVGDILEVNGSGTDAKAKVVSILNDVIGSVRFSITSGGTGYTTNAVVTVAKTLNLELANTQGYFIDNDTLVDANTSANGTVTSSNGTFAEVINFSPTLLFNVGDTVQTSTGNAVVTRVLGGTGSSASFRVGGITNKEIANVVTDFINDYSAVQLDNTSNSFDISVSSVSGTFTIGDNVTSTANVIQLEGAVLTSNSVASGEYFSNTSLGISGLYVYRGDVSHAWCVSSTDSNLTNANLVSGAILISDLSLTQLQLAIAPTKTTITGNATIEAANSTNVRISNVNGYFVATKTLNNTTSGGTATIASVARLTDWNFSAPYAGYDNLDKAINEVLTFTTLEIGTISFLSNINPGAGYRTRPYIDVIEPAIAGLELDDGFGNIKGHNAIIDSKIVNGTGIVTAVEVIDSGYGYLQNENLQLNNANNQTTISSVAIINEPGRGTGRWLNRKSFASDMMKLQDSYYYQIYSYDIIAEKMLSNYETLVRELVHPSGIALFGRYRLTDVVIGQESSTEEFSLTQA